MRTQSLLLITFLLFAGFACTSNGGNSPVGKWVPATVDSNFILSFHLSKDDIQNMMMHNSIEFTKDGKFISVSLNDTSSGIYNYDEKAKSLVTAADGGKTEKFSIEFLGNQMDLSNESGKVTFSKK